MPVKVNREILLQQLEAVQPGLSPREIVEQSSCFVFKGGKVITFNDEVACINKCAIPFTGAVQATPLLTMLRKLVEGDLEIDQREGELIIVGKRRKAGINMEQTITLPIDKIHKPKKWKELPEDFSEAVYIVQQCASTDASIFSLTCVHIVPKFMESCDNNQLTRYNIKTPVAESVLVRATSLQHIVSLGMTEFGETASWLHFRNPDGLIISCRRYVEEEKDFMDLGELLKVEGFETTLPKGLGEAADRAEIFSAENTDRNEVTVELRPGKMRMKGQGQTGWYSEVKKLNYNGEPIDFCISPKLLIELTKRHNECIISDKFLRVNGGKFVYVTVLGRIDDEQAEPTVEVETTEE